MSTVIFFLVVLAVLVLQAVVRRHGKRQSKRDGDLVRGHDEAPQAATDRRLQDVVDYNQHLPSAPLGSQVLRELADYLGSII